MSDDEKTLLLRKILAALQKLPEEIVLQQIKYDFEARKARRESEKLLNIQRKQERNRYTRNCAIKKR